jgi:predicted dinucleotide-binding enzyme
MPTKGETTMIDPQQYRQPVFGTRKTMDEAINYAYQIARASDNSAAVTTAVHVVLNTMINLSAEQAPEPLSHEQCLQAAKYMVFRGGSFASSIGDAYMVADGLNRPRLVAAFNDLFTRYLKETA